MLVHAPRSPTSSNAGSCSNFIKCWFMLALAEVQCVFGARLQPASGPAVRGATDGIVCSGRLVSSQEWLDHKTCKLHAVAVALECRGAEAQRKIACARLQHSGRFHAGLQPVQVPAVSEALVESSAARVRGPSATSGAAEELADKKAKKKMRENGIALFNEKPKKGVRQLQARGLLAADPAEVAHFLRGTEGLDYAAVGDYLSDPDEECKAVRFQLVFGM